MDTRGFQPNTTHIKLAELEKQKDLWIVTQNIDGLHQKAGSQNVLEIHGNTRHPYCRRCGKEYSEDYLFNCEEKVPLCTACLNEENPYCPPEQAYIRPRMTLYGEFLQPSFKLAIKKIQEADLLIFTTPNYCMMPSAPMKAFIDLFFTNWMSHKPYGEMFSKRAVVLSTAAGAGAKKATKPLATMLLYWGIPKVYSYGLAVNASSWENMPAKKKAIILRDMQRLGQKLSATAKPSVGIKTRCLFWLMKGMQKANWGAAPEEKAYWQEQGWLNGRKPWKAE